MKLVSLYVFCSAAGVRCVEANLLVTSVLVASFSYKVSDIQISFIIA